MVFRKKNTIHFVNMNERADLVGVNRSLISVRWYWGYGFGRKRPDRKGHGKTGKINNYVLCFWNYLCPWNYL